MLSGLLRNVNSQGKGIVLTEDEFKEIELIIAEDSTLKANNQELTKQVTLLTKIDSLCKANVSKYQNTIKGMDVIIMLKDGQIRELERQPVKVAEDGWKWWVKALVVAGSIAAGYTLHIIVVTLR